MAFIQTIEELYTVVSGQLTLVDEDKSMFSIHSSSKTDPDSKMLFKVHDSLPSGSLTPDTLIFKELNAENYYGMATMDFGDIWDLKEETE